MAPMSLKQFAEKMRSNKVSKFKKLLQLKDAINNLLATQEGVSDLLKEELQLLDQKLIPSEHAFQPGNNWEVKA